MTKWVYTFGDGQAEGSAILLGGKGANLAEMCNLGLPVPPGLTITTEACVTQYYDNGRGLMPDGLNGQYPTRWARSADRRRLSAIRQSAAAVGALRRPRLDAGHDGHGPQSRPQRRNGRGLARVSGDERFAYDSYRRFIQMYADVVMGVDHELFEEILEDEPRTAGVMSSTPMSDADDWREMIASTRRSSRRSWASRSRRTARAALGRDRRGVRSWMNPRAITYRNCTTSRKPGARRSTCRPWCSATWATARPPAWPSPAIRRPARRNSTASSGQRPGRGRGRRHPHAAADHRSARASPRAPTCRRWKR
jgi:pyruvate,orthophosphate dikinase